ncbi:MAG: PAC2 family protein [Acidimicrobiia bacterium]|nr:PAC2 family protein [Acidimicrobiia bacterium]
MDDDLYELLEPTVPQAAVLVCGLENWIDAGLAGAAAAKRLAAVGTWRTVARFDVDLLIDHQARRPTVTYADGRNEGLSWPSLELAAGTGPDGQAVLLLTGNEPDRLWRRFGAAVVDLAGRAGVELVVGLGSYPAPAPHTRPTRLVATATSEALAGRVGFVAGRLEVPAGIGAALEAICGDAGLDAIGLWAQVPHYVANLHYPAATAALLEGLGRLTGLVYDTSELTAAATETGTKIDQLVAQNPEHARMVTELERLVDAQLPAGPLPSADELAAELERFLRDQG